MSDGAKETTVIEAEPARPVGSSASAARSDRARQSSYRTRFGLVYFLLALVAGVAVGGFLVALTTTRPGAAGPVVSRLRAGGQ